MAEILPLPIDDYLEEISQKLKSHKNLVITAAPGAGKTTRLPPALLSSVTKKVLVLEPRRMAAIAAAHRIAEEQGWQVASEVGYEVRFANKSSLNTKIIFITEALLARKLIKDPELQDVDVVVLDEFHERSMHVDLALGLLKELQELGSKIKIVVMSATLEAEKISKYLDDCPIINVPGKLFPLEIRYQKNSQCLTTLPAFFENIATTIKDAQKSTAKDILVFLPGVGEIERTQLLLQDWATERNLDIVFLHGSINLEDQKSALKKGTRQRVILSTNIAESSVTIDGVDTVIDCGLAKSLKLDHKTGFSRLELGRISLSSAIQRSGRSARQWPGISYRLWNKMDELSFPKSEIPEIQRIDLSEGLLFLSAQGISDFNSFSWYEKPAPHAIKSAQSFLIIAGAIDQSGKITKLGRDLLHFPLPIRLAKVVLDGIKSNCIDLASSLAALLQERDILKKDSSSHFLGDNLECDLTARLETLNRFRTNQKAPRESHFYSLQTVDQSAIQIQTLAVKYKNQINALEVAPIPETEKIKKILLQSFADRLCRRRGKTDRGLMVGGRGIKLSAESLVKHSEFFVALSGVEGSSDSDTIINLACGFDKEFLLTSFKDQIQKSKEIIFSEEKGQFFVHEFRCLWGLPLDEPSVTVASSDEIAERLPQALAAKFDWVLKSNELLSRWWQRIQFYEKQSPQNLDWEKIRLEAFQQATLGENKIEDVVAKNLVFFFENAIPADIMKALQIELPDKIEMPSGSKILVHYPLDKAPYLEVRIQEIFGLMETPKVYYGKIPVTLHLLGPNFRPVQVTSNLESFWKNGYPEVRKELRIKYPKHQWPEDPSDGVPEAKGKRRY